MSSVKHCITYCKRLKINHFEINSIVINISINSKISLESPLDRGRGWKNRMLGSILAVLKAYV